MISASDALAVPSIKSQAQTNGSFKAISQASTSRPQASTSGPQASTSGPQVSTPGISFNNHGAGTMNNENIGNTFNAIIQGIKYPMEWVAADAFHNSKALNHDDAPKCHPHTRVAVLDDIMKWVHESASAGEAQDDFIMWLFGPAGAGKSAIARTIAELAAQQGILIGTFFFSRTSVTRNTPDRLIATLAYQLALSIPDTRSDILEAIERDPVIFDKNLETQIDTLLVKPLQSAQTKIVPSYKLIIIDGLDECNDRKAQVAILNVISRSFFSNHNLAIKFLIASRPEIDLVTSFNGNDLLKSVHRRLALDDTYHPDDDIRRFFSDKFKKIRSTHRLRSTIPTPWPTKESLERLVEKSSGQFIFAATVVKFVKSNSHRPVARLNIIFGTSPSGTMSPFAELDALYNQILSSVDDLKLTLRVLSLYIAAPSLARTLEDKKCAEQFLSLEEGDIDVALISLSSIVSYDEYSGNVKILHASLVDFLSDKQRSDKFYIDMGSTCTDFACRTLQFVQGPDGMRAGDFDLLSDGLQTRVREDGLIFNSQLRSSILDFDFDAFVTAVIYRYERDQPAVIKQPYCTWMFILTMAGLEVEDALNRCKNSFELRVERYQSDWRLQLLLTMAVVMGTTFVMATTASDGLKACRCLDILLGMDSHELHLVDQHALSLRHNQLFMEYLLDATGITSVYVDGDRYASAALHCMSFLSHPLTHFEGTDSLGVGEYAEWKATCRMALVLLCKLLQRANTSRELVQFMSNYDIDLVVRRQKFSVVQVDTQILAFLSRANVCVNWRIISAIRQGLLATDEVPPSKPRIIISHLTQECCCTYCHGVNRRFGNKPQCFDIFWRISAMRRGLFATDKEEPSKRRKITRHLTPKCEECPTKCCGIATLDSEGEESNSGSSSGREDTV